MRIACWRCFCDLLRQPDADNRHPGARRIERQRDVAQRNVELVIGRLVTDEAFRARFLRDPAATLAQFVEWGYELTSLEIAALEHTDPALWTRTAEQIDARLLKVSFGSC